jgi:hypothetical protein
MKTVRQIPVALNKPQTIIGIPSKVLIGSLLVFAFSVILQIPFAAKAILGVLLLASLAGIKGAIHGDKHRPVIYWFAFWRKAEYTRTKRKVFKLEVK